MRAYAQTAVAPEKSQNAIKKLLISHGASNVAFASATEPVVMEGLRATVVLDGRPYGVKIAVPVSVYNGKRRRSPGRIAEQQEQAVRRVWRVLFHHIKAIFEAADSGVIDIRELLLPFLVTKDGRTVGQIVMDDMPKALMAPKGILE